MSASQNLLACTLRTPESSLRFSVDEWDNLVRQARAAGLLAQLSWRFHQHNLTDSIPPYARWHFNAAETLSRKQQTAVRWELQKLSSALSELGCPLIMLKGAAYVAADLPASAGRMFNDIDILIPREHLPRAESLLMLAGWHATGLSEYDKRYYRRWMHEIPPLKHAERETVIDVHHAILPDTARYHPDSAKLRNRAIPVNAQEHIYVLAPEDMLLHSATHLFHEGDLIHGLRDLTDIDLLLRHFSLAPQFWQRLRARANELELGRPLFYAVRYVRYFLDTPVPQEFVQQIQAAAPNRVTLALMDAAFSRALAPAHPGCSDALTPLARKAAYVRAHWLRMPPHLLLPHLVHKAFINPHYDTRTT